MPEYEVGHIKGLVTRLHKVKSVWGHYSNVYTRDPHANPLVNYDQCVLECVMYVCLCLWTTHLWVWDWVAVGRPPPSFGPFHSLSVTLTQNTIRIVGTPNPQPLKLQAFWNDLMQAERAQLASSTCPRLRDAGRGLLGISTSDPVWRVGSCQ